MRVDVEGQPPVAAVCEVELRADISTLRSEGTASFACLTDEAGAYRQVAGGVPCMMAPREARGPWHFRAFRDRASSIFADGTLLVFGGGTIRLRADEWFTTGDVAAVFVSFLRGEPLPGDVRWRDISRMLSRG